jgi:hypothetical protein
MKEQVEKLIELAKDYVVFGIEIGLPDTHNHIRGGHQEKPEFHKEGDLVSIYFSDKGETWSVTFKDVTIVGYSSKFEMPMNADVDYLSKVYNSAKDYLNEHLLPNVAKCKIATLKERHVKIKELERELRKMKGLC